GMFPAVPDQSAGVRFTITIHHTKEDIEFLVDRLAWHYPRTFQELGRSVQDIVRGFQRIKTFEKLIDGIPYDITRASGFEVQHETSILNIPKDLWNRLMGNLGANDWDQLLFFEQTFSGNSVREHN